MISKKQITYDEAIQFFDKMNTHTLSIKYPWREKEIDLWVNGILYIDLAERRGYPIYVREKEPEPEKESVFKKLLKWR